MSSKTKRKLTEILFLLPTLLAFVLVIIIPFIMGIYYSFTDWQGTGAVTRMVGFENYAAIFKEPAFLQLLRLRLLLIVFLDQFLFEIKYFSELLPYRLQF